MVDKPEMSRIEVDAEDAGVPVPDFFAKAFNGAGASEGAKVGGDDIAAKVDTGGYEYRITVTLPKDDVPAEELNAMIRLANKYDSLFFLSLAPKTRALQAIYIWDRPVKHKRLGDVGPDR